MDDKWCKELKEKLEQAFLKSDKSKEEFAKEVGISFETLHRFLQGQRLYVASMRKIIKYLDQQTKSNNKNDKK